MVSMKGKVAVVTGASRGVGKGIALGLGEAGATVYVTGRSAEEKQDVESWVAPFSRRQRLLLSWAARESRSNVTIGTTHR